MVVEQIVVPSCLDVGDTYKAILFYCHLLLSLQFYIFLLTQQHPLFLNVTLCMYYVFLN